MDKRIIDEIIKQTDIVSLVSEFIPLEKTGKNYRGLCPFHQEKTPSFSVSPEKNIAKCMSCGEGGNPINFFRKIKNISYEEAVSILASRLGLKVVETKKADPNDHLYKLMARANEFYQFNLFHSEEGEKALAYLKDRGLTKEIINHFQIGYAAKHSNTLYQVLVNEKYKVSDMIDLGLVKQDKNGDYYDLFSERIMFPITSNKGFVVGFSGRTINPKDDVKYMNSPETKIFKKGELLYHYFEGLSDIRKSKHVILYEGFFDCISSYVAGVKNGVATMGTSLTKAQAKLIKNISEQVIICYDGDKAGQKATYQAISILENESLKIDCLIIPEELDPDDFIHSYGFEAYNNLFSDHLIDYFSFRYQYLKKDIDFNNANDIKSFKQNVLSILKNADKAIRDIYLKRLAKDLNISIDSLIDEKKLEKVNTLKIKDDIKLDKYIRAERYLIIALLQNKNHLKQIKNGITTKDYANPIGAVVRKKLMLYLEENQVFDLEGFLGTLDFEQRSYMDLIFTDLIWREKIIISNLEVALYIKLVKEAKLKRRLTHLLEKIASNPKNEEYYKEIIMIQKELANKEN